MSLSLIARLQGIRAAEVSQQPLLKTSVPRRERDALLREGCIRERGVLLVTTQEGRRVLAVYELGRLAGQGRRVLA